MNFCECISSIDITQFFLYHAYILFSFQIFSSKSKALLFYFPSAGKQNFEIKIERNCFSTLFVSWFWIFFNFAFWFFFFRFSDTLLHHYIRRCNNELPDYFWLYTFNRICLLSWLLKARKKTARYFKSFMFIVCIL